MTVRLRPVSSSGFEPVENVFTFEFEPGGFLLAQFLGFGH